MVFRAGADCRKHWACRHKGSWCHMLQDKLRAQRVSELSAQSPGWTHSGTWHPGFFYFLFQRFICFSSFLTLSVSLLLNSGLQGDILTVIRRVDEHWIEAKLGEKVGVCPLQFTEVSSSEFSLSLVIVLMWLVAFPALSRLTPAIWHFGLMP